MAYNEIPVEFQRVERERKLKADAAHAKELAVGRPYDAVQNLAKKSVFDANKNSVPKDGTVAGGLIDAPAPFRSNERGGFRFDEDRVPGAKGSEIDLDHQYAAPRRSFDTQAEAGPQYNAPRSISGDTKGAEEERKARLSDIDSALFSMRGKPLRHRGQQMMFMQLNEMKNKLTSQAYDTQNERDVAGAKMANEGAQFGAGLAERGAERRDTANRFNAGMGWDMEKFDMESRQKQAEAMAAAPGNALDLKKKEIDVNAADAAARRGDDEYAIGRDASLDKGFNETMTAYKAVNPEATYEETAMAALENTQQGSGPVAPAARAVQRNLGDKAVSDLNGGTNLLEDLWAGKGRLPFTQETLGTEELGTMDEKDLEYTPTGGVLGAARRFVGSPTYDVTPKGRADDNRAPRARVLASKAESALRRRNMDLERKERAEKGY